LQKYRLSTQESLAAARHFTPALVHLYAKEKDIALSDRFHGAAVSVAL
jgi:hypothetical protein